MSGERHAIDHPLGIDFSTAVVPALSFFLRQGYAPAGLVETPAIGKTIRRTPWYSELVTEVSTDEPGDKAQVVLYWLPKDGASSLLLACLGQTVTPFFNLITGDDFGDRLTAQTALHWPDVYGLLLNGQDGRAAARMLCTVQTPQKVQTAQKVQWVIADTLRGPQHDEVSNERVLGLMGAALETFVKVANFATELPGVIEILGGPDRMSRRLSAVSRLLGATADIGTALGGGIRLDELLGLAKAVREGLQSARDLKE